LVKALISLQGIIVPIAFPFIPWPVFKLSGHWMPSQEMVTGLLVFSKVEEEGV
jgi:hypothetical protein